MSFKLIEGLLNTDKSKFVRETKEIEIKRLTKLTGEPFVLKIQSITPDEEKEISDKAFKIKRDNRFDFDNDLSKKMMILKGVTDFDFKNSELMEHLGAINSHDLIGKLFIPGEIDEIEKQIKCISGYDDGVVEEVKN